MALICTVESYSVIVPLKYAIKGFLIDDGSQYSGVQFHVEFLVIYGHGNLNRIYTKSVNCRMIMCALHGSTVDVRVVDTELFVQIKGSLQIVYTAKLTTVMTLGIIKDR